jgi:hypothetical protein
MLPSGFTRTALLLLTAAAAIAQEPKAKPEEESSDSLPPKKAALERMLSERGTEAELEAAIAKAQELGVGDQAALEARFLYHVDRQEDDKLAAMLPEFQKRKSTFKLEESEIFAVREDWLAVVEYVEAIAALRKNDRDGFKKHITEAFWLSPRQGSAFAPHIDRLRMDEAMRDVKIEPTTKLASLFAGEEVELAALTKDKKALLLHFWSPWNRECEASMPDFKVTATELQKHGIAVASLLADSTPDAIKDAKDIAADLGTPPPGAWLVDREKDSLHRLLRIQSVPSMVLVSSEGRVLFNGHPSEDRLWEALTKLAPDIKRPPVKEE